MLANLSTLENTLMGHFQYLHRELENSVFIQDIPNASRRVVRRKYPPVNIATTDNEYNIYLFASGLESDSIEISLEKNILSINTTQEAESSEEANSILKERYTGPMHQEVMLPDDIDGESINAKYNDGVLNIVIRRVSKQQARKINVQ